MYKGKGNPKDHLFLSVVQTRKAERIPHVQVYSTKMPPPIFGEVKGTRYKSNLMPFILLAKKRELKQEPLPLQCLEGSHTLSGGNWCWPLRVLSARRQLRSGHSLVSKAWIGRGHFLTLRGERGPVPVSWNSGWNWLHAEQPPPGGAVAPQVGGGGQVLAS